VNEIDVLHFTFLGISIGTLSKFALIIIMVSMGVTLKIADFKILLQRPKPVLVGLLGQIIILPIIGVAITLMVYMPPAIAVGLIIIAACPGGATSNFMTYLARGDVALSVVLTAISGVLAVFTVPYVINYGLTLHGFSEQGLKLPVLKTIWNIFTLTVLPVLVGMLVRQINARVAEKAEKILTPASFLVLLMVMALIARQVWSELPVMLNAAVWPVLMLNAVMVFIGVILALVMGLPRKIGHTIGIEIGFQNYTLAVVIALVMLQSPEMTITPIIYLFSMYVTGVIVVLLARRATKASVK